jgi:hypothetical protein
MLHLNWQESSLSYRIVMPTILKVRDSSFKLMGYSVHSGFGSSCGHYYSYVVNQKGKWSCCTDSSTRDETKPPTDFSESRSRPILVIYENIFGNRTIAFQDRLLKFKDKLMDGPEKIKMEVEKTINNKSEVYHVQRDRQFVDKEVINLQSTKEE